MTDKIKELILRLDKDRSLSLPEYEELIRDRDSEAAELLAELALKRKKEIFGDAIYTRGLIEISSICKNDCIYCGIRCSNDKAERYRLSEEEILDCSDEGYELGFRTFVLQGGEDPYYTDEILCSIVQNIKAKHPDCAVTLSVGERTRDSYQALYDAGADRYLLRHETADPVHYAKLHPASMSYDNRMRCLRDLKEIGYQVGCGFMVGSPYQTQKELARDLKFIEEFGPAMCGIGPFIPHRNTPFRDEQSGTMELTLYLLSVLRLINPKLLLPATTALGTVDPRGREKGVLAGANVVMPNLSPRSVRKKYELYDNKICTGEESAQCRGCLELRMESVGAYLAVDRGDAPGYTI
ncbi:[FeFe] hydrogenase H-cluster radical SAM maturase HydE [Butyrivibrio sp. MC2013]|uniref:[FeFe] hydrogenase H-cluster radical SAM maturase HydE n=1 Tax=Butyrivibrio sp. MC2013 TaxID=1280686 RepID=UPI0004033712|nr:[FeFe] hydrogenase H-cluster radical SAM maturase HydE [Butyrivibrio sp. MC2013]